MVKIHVRGMIGSISLIDQYQAINNIALWMLMSNRVSKEYQAIADRKGEQYMDNKKRYNIDSAKKWLNQKDQAFCTLIACLNVLNVCNTENDPFYKINYGMTKDLSQEFAKDAFIIDVPGTGQMSIHFGNAARLNRNLRNIDNLTETILELQKESLIKKKVELGMSRRDAELSVSGEIKRKRKIPQYTGRLYETSSAIPLELNTVNQQAVTKHYFKESWNPQYDEIDRFVQESGYNPREIHYWAVKSEWNGELIRYVDGLLEKIIKSEEKTENQKMTEDQVTILGKSAVMQTTPEERFEIMNQRIEMTENQQTSPDL